MSQAQFYTDFKTAPTPNRPRRVGVAAALFDSLDRVLLEFRADSDYWAFISGGVKGDESVGEALAREIAEETGGATAVDPSLFAVYSNPGRITAYPDGNVSQIITFAFVAQLDGSDLAPSEESRKLEMFALNELSDLEIAPTHHQFATDLAESGRTIVATRFD